MYSQSSMLRAVVLVLCATVAVEWLLPAASPRVPTFHERGPAGVTRSSAAHGDPPAEYAAAVLARPLFSISRRPPREKARSAAETDALPRLSGIMINGVQKRAIFEGDGKPKVTAVGDQVGDYKILAILPSAVKVGGPHGTELVSLTFDASKRTILTPPFSGPGLLNQFRLQRPPNLPVPQPPTIEQMMAHLPRAAR